MIYQTKPSKACSLPAEHATKKRGFTLIELSIVLIIIGFIVSGVIVGNALMEGAKLRKVISDVENTKTTINTFRLKYNCLPGDCPNAATFFSSACASGNATNCNGNGDRMITWWTGHPQRAEAVRLWEHLKLAELISGNYTGVYTAMHVIGTNLPPSAIEGGAYGIYYIDINSRNSITLGAPAQGAYNMGPALTPLQAHQIDRKTDDGQPLTGRTWAQGGALFPTGTATCRSGNSYDLSATDKGCAMRFQLE